jgi:hypothetical protein
MGLAMLLVVIGGSVYVIRDLSVGKVEIALHGVQQGSVLVMIMCDANGEKNEQGIARDGRTSE